MTTYLNTVKELQAIALADLGPMDKTTYAAAVNKAKQIGLDKGVKRPKIGLGIIFKPGAHEFLSEIPYPISEHDVPFDSDCLCL
jgi:hypothetical protein